MTILIAAIFLCPILAMLSPGLQAWMKRRFLERPAAVFFAPVILSLMFCAIAAALGALSAPLATLIVIYSFAPTLLAYAIRSARPPAWGDFAIILLLWLPLEFSVGQFWTPRAVQGPLHIAAYGVSVILGLTLFLTFRRLTGMKYNLPPNPRDFGNALIGFALAAPVLIVVGLAVGFIPPFHMPAKLSFASLAGQYLVIFLATALPEEILFRSMIQNSLMQKFGSNFRTLLIASLIFGAAHFDNGPGPLPNWRYAIVASIAGFAYGKVFQKSTSVFASASLHALVNLIKHVSF